MSRQSKKCKGECFLIRPPELTSDVQLQTPVEAPIVCANMRTFAVTYLFRQNIREIQQILEVLQRLIRSVEAVWAYTGATRFRPKGLLGSLLTDLDDHLNQRRRLLVDCPRLFIPGAFHDHLAGRRPSVFLGNLTNRQVTLPHLQMRL
jgi:hypothetical protein